MQAAAGRGRHRRVGGMRRQHRQRQPPVRHRLPLGGRHLVGRHQTGGGKAVEHAVAGVVRRRPRPVGPALLRRLRQRHQERGFRQRQPARLLAEIGERGGADAFQIAPIGGEAEIEREDLILAELPLDLDRPHHLAQLGHEAALAARLQQAGDLHAQRGGARHDVTVAHELAERAAERQRIDAMVLEEAFVLIGEQEFEEARIDILARRRQPPASLIGRIGPQQAAIAIDHQGGEREPAPSGGGPSETIQRANAASKQRRRHEPAIKVARRRAAASSALRRSTVARRRPRSGRRAGSIAEQIGGHGVGVTSLAGATAKDVVRGAHLAAVTSIVPVPVRPKRSGRYMSSTVACGST